MRTKLDQDKFCEQFVAVFCASWCAKHYEDVCINNEQERLEKPPIEDAVYLADCAWTEYVNVIGL